MFFYGCKVNRTLKCAFVKSISGVIYTSAHKCNVLITEVKQKHLAFEMCPS